MVHATVLADGSAEVQLTAATRTATVIHTAHDPTTTARLLHDCGVLAMIQERLQKLRQKTTIAGPRLLWDWLQFIAYTRAVAAFAEHATCLSHDAFCATELQDQLREMTGPPASVAGDPKCWQQVLYERQAHRQCQRISRACQQRFVREVA